MTFIENYIKAEKTKYIIDSDGYLKSVFPRLDQKIEALRKLYEIPGLGLGLSYKGNPIYFKGFGYANKEKQTPITINTQFRCASITKSFTSIMMLQQRDRQRVALDDALVKYLPEVEKIKPYSSHSRPITLRQIASHSSGLPVNGDFDRWDGEEMQNRETIINSLDIQCLSPPGQIFRYSNIGYILLGLGLQKVAQTPYDEYIDTHILKPLKMKDSGMKYGQEKNKTTEATGYQKDNDKIVSAPIVGYNDCSPAGGLLTSVNDMLIYLKFLMSEKENTEEYKDILHADSIRELLNPVIMMKTGSSYQAYGMGFFISEFQGQKVVGHSGGTWGFCSNIAMVQELDFAYALWYNYTSAEAGSFKEINDNILKIMIPVLKDLEEQEQKLKKINVLKKKNSRIIVFQHIIEGQWRVYLPIDQSDLHKDITLDYKSKTDKQKGIRAEYLKEDSSEVVDQFGNSVQVKYKLLSGSDALEKINMYYEGGELVKIKIAGQFFYKKKTEPVDKFD